MSDADLDHRQRCGLRHRRRAAEGIGPSLPLHRAGGRRSRRGSGLIERDLCQRRADRRRRRASRPAIGSRWGRSCRCPGHRLRACRERRVVRIGRMADNDIVLDDPRVSSHHARLIVSECRTLIEDTGSANGTTSIRPITRRRRRSTLGETDTVYFGSLAVPAAPTLVAATDGARGDVAAIPPPISRSRRSIRRNRATAPPSVGRGRDRQPLDDPPAGPGAGHRDPDPPGLRPPGRRADHRDELARGCGRASPRRRSRWHWRRSGWAARSPYGHRWRADRRRTERASLEARLLGSPGCAVRDRSA